MNSICLGEDLGKGDFLKEVPPSQTHPFKNFPKAPIPTWNGSLGKFFFGVGGLCCNEKGGRAMFARPPKEPPSSKTGAFLPSFFYE